MAGENNIFLMVHFMKVIGRMIKLTAVEELFMWMVMLMKENGLMIRHMDKVFIIMLMERNMLANGKKTNKYVLFF